MQTVRMISPPAVLALSASFAARVSAYSPLPLLATCHALLADTLLSHVVAQPVAASATKYGHQVTPLVL